MKFRPLHASLIRTKRPISVPLCLHRGQVTSAGHPPYRLFSQAADGHKSLLPIVLSSRNLILRDIPKSLSDHRQVLVASRTAENTLQDEESLVPFFVGTKGAPPVGFLRPSVVRHLEREHSSHIVNGRESPWELLSSSGTTHAVSFTSKVVAGGVQARTHSINQSVEGMKHNSAFDELLKGWSNESFPVYEYTPDGPTPKNTLAFTIERAALPIFGFPNFGCLLIAYYRTPSTGELMFWIPRRSHTKKTWPGRLDVTVGGGLAAGDTAVHTIIRECAEEASLDVDFVRTHLRPSGVLPFPNRSPAGWLLPGLYHLFELPLPPDGTVRPRANEADGEVDNFELMDARSVLENLAQGVFKPSSALAILDFFIRHGLLTGATEPHFEEIVSLLKVKTGIAALDECGLLPH
ncbi:hypothetical protein DENSPDRAFT_822230 [Dentipellis sp. KUC8613]|nr:hypothetical protein DENSPDRAFT_822230 [Dentipellis sp. KUC8613]